MIPAGPLPGLLPGLSLGEILGLSLGVVVGLSMGVVVGISRFQRGLNHFGDRCVVEFVHAAPQQLPVVSCCVTHQTEAENKSCHLIVTQLLMTGGCQGVACTNSTTSSCKNRVEIDVMIKVSDFFTLGFTESWNRSWTTSSFRLISFNFMMLSV